MTDFRVAAIVLGWNLADISIACIESLESQTHGPLDVIYVDNGSTDGAPATVGERFPNARIVALSENVGIAAGYNAGLRIAIAGDADAALILNNDTVLAPDAIAELVAAARRQSSAGVLMPKILHERARTRIWSAGARRRSFPPGVVFLGLGQADGPAWNVERDIEFAPSCALLITREALRRVGVFDPDYFFYYDDWDYCERARRAGFTIRYVPGAVVWHKVSLSTARSSQPARWWYVMGRSAVIYYRRYYRPFPPYVALYAAWFVAREALKGNARFLGLYLRGLWDGLTGRSARLPA
ncbi:MAG: glycosyltransferase family 2 protein [Chloroflexota bacterium]|nr:MAG: glycosyltransferase family 2 protein [Chloroflexota bacterium]